MDSVEIVNMPFADPIDLDAGAAETFFGLTGPDIQRIIEVIVLGGVGLLIALLVIRPLVSKIFETSAVSLTMEDDEPAPALITDQSGALIPAPAGMGGAMVPGGGDDDDAESMIDIAHIEGRVKASSMKKIGEIIDKHPEEAVAILRNWMYQESS